MNEYLDHKKNLYFSCLNRSDLEDLLFFLIKYNLDYRDVLNLSNNVTFGGELEYEGINKVKVDYYFNEEWKLRKWISAREGPENKGGEIKTPICVDKKKTWLEIKKVFLWLKKNDMETLNNCAGHIHVGAHILGDDVDKWRLFIKLFAIYENVIFRFSYGEKINARESIDLYSKKLRDYLFSKMHLVDSFSYYEDFEYLCDGRNKSFNLCNVKWKTINNKADKNTIEFRCPNMTSEEVIWQNNVNFFTKLLLAPSKNLVDEDFLDYKLNDLEQKNYNDVSLYNDVCLKDSLELVDLVFNNNLDKIYFLRQYIKNFEDNYNVSSYKKARVFYK